MRQPVSFEIGRMTYNQFSALHDLLKGWSMTGYTETLGDNREDRRSFETHGATFICNNVYLWIKPKP